MQLEIVESVLSGADTLGLLPTGGGKSVTFQVPALMLPGLTVVVTPLISLMKDQVDNLRDRGVTAVCLHSGLSRAEHKLGLDRCRLGKARLLYLSPEKLRSKTFLDQLGRMDVSLIVVDEAHCISQWGYDFRPSYLRIAELRTLFPEAPVLALTASATPEVRADIMERLGFREPKVFARSFARPNISYVVRLADHKDGLLLKALHSTVGSAIVYVRSRKRTRELSEMLTAEGISAAPYHAGLDPVVKAERQALWKSGRVRVIVATNAFGMGIDKPDVRIVVHYDLPPSLEEYYQEAGRAGRDGQPAYALLIASRSDKGLLSRRITEAFPPRDYIRRVYELACVFTSVAVGEGYDTVRQFDFPLFCTRFHLQPAMTRSALMLLSRSGWFEYVDEVASRSRAMVTLTREELYGLRLDPVADRVFQLLLRTYTGLFADYVNISEELISQRLSLSADEVYQALLSLSRAGAVSYVPRSTMPYIYFTTRREETRHVLIPTTIYEDRRRVMERRIRAMQDYVFRADTCRVERMLRYFGDPEAGECGRCDICREARPARPAKPEPTLADTILYIASQPGGHTIDYIASQLSLPAPRIIAAARPLLDSGRLTLTPAGRLTTSAGTDGGMTVR